MYITGMLFFWMNGEAFLYQAEPRMSLGNTVLIKQFTNSWTDSHIYAMTAHRKLCLLPTLPFESLEPALVRGRIDLLPICEAWRPPSRNYKLQFLRWIVKQNRRGREDVRSKLASYWRLIFALQFAHRHNPQWNRKCSDKSIRKIWPVRATSACQTWCNYAEIANL